MENVKTETKNEADLTEPAAVDLTIRQEVLEIKDAVEEVVSETSLSDKVDELRTNLENVSGEVDNWRGWYKNTYLEVLETLKSQVDDIQKEWDNVAGSMTTQRERLESLLVSFPGAIETSTIRTLSLRLTHLEKLVSELILEAQSKSTTARARKQLIISLAALGVTIILWGVWIGLAFLK